MTFFRDEEERALAEGLAVLISTNPFLPARLEREREVLGDAFAASSAVWHRGGPEDLRNLELLGARAADLAEALRRRLAGVETPLPRDVAELIRDVFLYHLYHRTLPDLRKLVEDPARATRPLSFWPRFRDEARAWLELPALARAPRRERETDPAHQLAIFFQVRRAFEHAFQPILGGSLAAAGLRAAIWESIFTHDMRRYRRGLFDRLREVTTLITGPSGTGKELVARAIARAGYIPFDPVRGCFLLDESTLFRGLNLASLSPTLVEAELFGARRGAYTGSVEDRSGWLESCPEWGAIFLDEVGEIGPELQVKLLRVLQTRGFSRLGETDRRSFAGRFLAATNRDPEEELAAGRLRPDFFYRICSDRIVTPSLADQLREDPEELRPLLGLLAERFLDADEAESIADETWDWIRTALPPDYPWPGNFRELEQCLRNVLVHRSYHPPRLPGPGPDDLDRPLRTLGWTADELLDRYCAVAVEEEGSYSAAARRLGLDRRTVRARAESHRQRTAST